MELRINGRLYPARACSSDSWQNVVKRGSHYELSSYKQLFSSSVCHVGETIFYSEFA